MNLKSYLLNEEKIPQEIELGNKVYRADWAECDTTKIHLVYREKK